MSFYKKIVKALLSNRHQIVFTYDQIVSNVPEVMMLITVLLKLLHILCGFSFAGTMSFSSTLLVAITLSTLLLRVF